MMINADLIRALLPMPYATSGERLSAEIMADGAALDAVQARDVSLMRQLSPLSADELLSDWEQSLGLPDACAPAAQTLDQRRRAVAARWSEFGGQSRAYFIGLAALRGYVISITEPQTHQWRVTVPDTALVVTFRAGSGQAGQPLRYWQTHPMNCTLRRACPAHTRLWMAFAGAIYEPWLIEAVQNDGEASVDAAIDLLHTTLHQTMPDFWS